VVLPVPIPRTASVAEIETGGYGNATRDALSFLLNPPLLRVAQSAVQSLATGVWTSITFDATVIDTYGMHSNSTNNTRAVAIVPGWYWPSGVVAFAANSTSTRGARFAVNGTPVQGSAQFGPPTATGSLAYAAVSLPLFLNAGDYVELQASQATGGALNSLVATDLCSTMSLFLMHA
jgi:hypothetical protein